MNGLLVDSCVLLDLFTDDPIWSRWSRNALEEHSKTSALYINSIIYAEISTGFEKIEEVEAAAEELRVTVLEIPREALFLTAKVFLNYRRNKGTKVSPMPDFFIGAHAAVSDFGLITRDLKKYRTYFPKVSLIHPETSETPQDVT